jgi:cytochrome c553
VNFFRVSVLAIIFGISSSQAQVVKTLDTEKALKTCAGTITDACVVRHFKDTHEASLIRGKIVYQNYCVLCHGAEGKGDGRAAKLHKPRPFDLTFSVAPREYTADILKKGGEAMNRGIGMPPWEEQLTDEQFTDILNYLFDIRVYK